MSGVLGGLIGSLGVKKVTFSAVTFPATELYNAGGFDNSFSVAKFFIKGNGASYSTAVYYSTGGSSWTTGTISASMTGRGFGGPAGSLILAGHNAANTDVLVRTTNGTTWTTLSRAFTGSLTTSYFSYLNGVYLFFGGNNLATSTNGTNWNTTINLGIGINHVGYGNGAYIAVGNGTAGSQSSARRATTSPTTSAGWSTITLPSAANWMWADYNNGTWLAICANATTAATSTDDGLTWTSRTLPQATAASGTALRTKAAVFNNKFYYIGSNGFIYSSADGVNWTQETSSSLGIVSAYAIAESSDKLVFAASQSTGVLGVLA